MRARPRWPKGSRTAADGTDPAEQGLDVRRVLHRPVGPEVELGRDAQLEMLAEPVADEAPGAGEGRQRSGPLGVVAED
jgi:hypothetical protein